jgi:ubiquinone/menaquinone biosynthesis C-methylase UbiE
MAIAESKNEIKDFYSSQKTAQGYIDERFNNAIGLVMHRRQIELINDSIKRFGVKTVLEIAPGPARISVDVRGFEKGVMIDLNSEMLKVARERLESKGLEGKWALTLGDAFAIDLKEKVDLVYTFRFIRHFKIDMRKKLYDVVKRALKDKGLFIFDAPNLAVCGEIRKNKDLEKIYDELYTKESLVAELEENGFRVLKTKAVWAHYLKVQYWIQVLVGPRWPWGAYQLINMFESDNAKDPLEWVVLCQKAG